MELNDLIQLQITKMGALILKASDESDPRLKDMMQDLFTLVQISREQAEVLLVLTKARNEPTDTAPEPVYSNVGKTVFILKDGGYTFDKLRGYDLVGAVVKDNKAIKQYTISLRDGSHIFLWHSQIEN